MHIIDVIGPIENCRINQNKISDLPTGLKTLAIKVMKSLRANKIREVRYDFSKPLDSLCRLPQGFKTLATTELSKEAISELEDFLKLLDWWQKPHWRANNPGALGGGSSCADCNYSEYCCYHSEYCPMPQCPSHEKWARILGPSYKKPELPKLDKELIDVLKKPSK